MEKIKGLLKSRKTASFLLSFVITLIIDISIVTVRHSIINISFVLTFFALPFIGLFLIFRLIFSEKKIISKIVLSVITAVVSISLIFGFFMVGCFEELTSYKNEKVEAPYSKITNDSMPELNELGNPVNIELFKYYSSFAVFHYDTDILICKYNEDEYSLQKELLDEKYIFLKEYDGNTEVSSNIGDYYFRLLSAVASDFPEEVVLVATNDEKNEVVYISCDNGYLNYSDKQLTEFIENDCGWKHIR